MFNLLSRLLFLKLPLNERMFKFWFDFFEWAFRLLVAAEASLFYYAIFGKAALNEFAPSFIALLLPTYLAYVAVHFMNGCEDFFKGKD